MAAEHTAEETGKHIKETAEHAAHAVTHAVGKAKRKVQRVVRHSPSTSNGKQGGAARTARNGVRNLDFAAIQDKAASTLDTLTQQLVDLKDKGVQSTEAIENAIVQNPKTSVLIAVGVGYVWARLRRWI